jgi:hypothetical protein
MSPQARALLCAGAALLSVSLYGIVLIQLKRGVPDRFKAYSVELSVLGVGGVCASFAKHLDPVLIALCPGLAYGACLVAGRGSVLRLLSDARYGDARGPAVRRAQRRLVALLLGGAAVAVTIAEVKAFTD